MGSVILLAVLLDFRTVEVSTKHLRTAQQAKVKLAKECFKYIKEEKNTILSIAIWCIQNFLGLSESFVSSGGLQESSISSPSKCECFW